MFHDLSYPAILAASDRAAWQIDEVIGPGAAFDFSKPFMPESLARTHQLNFLAEEERLTLNHIRAHEYLSLFGLVEEFILPFIMDHVRPDLPNSDDVRVRALLQFAAEEAKHIQLLKRFHQLFVAGFGTQCELIGPPKAIAKVVLGHQPLSIALFILMIEWMTQSHYVGSVRGEAELDPLFANLLRCHWVEEAQHAKLDTLMVEALAEGMTAREIHGAVNGFLAHPILVKGAPEAVVEVGAQLVSARSNQVVASRAFRATAPAAATDIGSVSRAFETALGQVATEVVGWTLVEGERSQAAGPTRP